MAIGEILAAVFKLKCGIISQFKIPDRRKDRIGLASEWVRLLPAKM